MFIIAQSSIVAQNSQFPSSVLKTATQEYSTTGSGYLHYDINEEGFVRTTDNNVSFSNGLMSSLWVAALDPNYNLMASGAGYSISESDFSPGLLEDNGDPLVGSEEFFNRIWTVHDFEILKLIELFEDEDLTIDDIPEHILTWPGKGNPYVDPNFVSRSLAPFHDRILDGIYDPLDGDYPQVFEGYNDYIISSFAYSVYNDNSGSHPYINGEPLKIEVQQIQFVVNCNEFDIANTVFTHLEITNWGIDDLRDFRLGIHIDPDLGCSENDLFGVDTLSNSIYFYNDSGLESEDCELGLDGVGTSVTAIRAFVIVSSYFHQFSSVVPMYGSIQPDPEDNNNDIKLYTWLHGNFDYNQPMTFGGNGINEGSTEIVKFPFTDFPNIEDGWSMQTSELDGSSKDFNVLASIAKENINAGSSIKFEFADVNLLWDGPIGHDVFDDYRLRLNTLINETYEVITDHSMECDIITSCTSDCVWPGDANQNGRVEASDYLYIKAAGNKQIHNLERELITYAWYPQTSEEYGIDVDGIDIKHSDVDGNGFIDIEDIHLVRDENYSFINDSYVRTVDQPQLDVYGLEIVFENNEVDASGNLLDRLAKAKIECGKDGFFSDSIIGISYEITWDERLIELSGFFTNQEGDVFEQTEVHFEYLGDHVNNLGVDYDKVKRLEIAKFTLGDHQTINAGKLSENSWVAKQEAETLNVDGRDTTYIRFENILALKSDGSREQIGVKGDYPIIITNLIYNPSLSISEDQETTFVVFPNPTVDGFLNLSLPIESYELIDMEGRLIESEQFALGVDEINVSNVSPGMYFLRCKLTNEEIRVKKVVKQ